MHLIKLGLGLGVQVSVIGLYTCYLVNTLTFIESIIWIVPLIKLTSAQESSLSYI